MKINVLKLIAKISLYEYVSPGFLMSNAEEVAAREELEKEKSK